MESTGIKKCHSGLNLSLAVPGHVFNLFSISDGGSDPSGHSNGNAAAMAVHLDINDPASRGEENLEVPGGAVEVKEDEENGGVRSQHLKNTQLSEYRLKHRIDSVS
ncbi:hypothetical protein GUJ93_ZPchr0005g16207 [Zizania palustris]|uniref:Uncharacterized protein n=1 Tax=Zizania palustris TaxID=103762 RepID=A0A8J5W214_ZIZPA|nr:hypothetical protein GUJ93_ZPchr0005g16207 [Zizania palustris]